MKKIHYFFLIMVTILCLAACSTDSENPTAAPEVTDTPVDSNAIATATTGDATVAILEVADFADAVDASGNTVITLLQDISHPTSIRLPYSCTIDFNGHTIATSPNAGHGIEIHAAGTENPVTTLRNGTMTQYGFGVQVTEGGIVVENMTIHSVSGSPVALYSSKEDYKALNRVENSTLFSAGSSILFFKPDNEFPGSGITIANSTLVAHNPSGDNVFARNGSTDTITLGENVELYSYSQVLAQEGFLYSGNIASVSAETKSFTIGDTTYDGLRHWSTNNEDTSIQLLMIGNSFCYNYVQELYGMAQTAGVDITVTNLYEGGCTVEEHWNWLTNKTEGADKYEFWITNTMGRWKHGDIRTSYEALDWAEWDVITLQQHFGRAATTSYEKAVSSCTPYTKDLYDKLKADYPDATFYWHETWAYQVGHSDFPDKASQTAQQNIIIQVSEEICQENNVSMIPSGDAWAIARSNPNIGDTLCKSDLYHDGDLGGGQYLNACVWFEVLTGKSCIGNTWRPDYSLSEEKITQLQQAAHQAVAAEYGSDYAK